MGRQLEEHGNYERNVGYLVENTKTVLQSTFHELKTDVHIIPIEWHAKLHSLVDERMSLASLKTVPKVRMVMNDYLADILYYFNSHFGSVIIRMIVDELNEAYETFMAKHPDFNGKISVFALSLGGVAMFDILTCMDDDDDKSDAEDYPEAGGKQGDQEASSKMKPRVRKQDHPKFRTAVPKLRFRPHHLFTVGSPVGAILVMRDLDWETFHPPDDIIHHNLFHPFDPLGYRVEPLIDSVFAGIPAVTLSSYSSSQQLFPTISLPSLPSLLPESISLFWENKVPALPRPSIPTLSSLSQMTQSLKAGRWLSGNGGTIEDSEMTTPMTTRDDLEENSTIHGEVTSLPSATDGNPEAYNGASMFGVVDADASVTEYMAAVTVATYLDQSGTSTSENMSADSSAMGAHDTTTGATHPRTTPSRKPSLGPRRVSSRVEDEQTFVDAAVKLHQEQNPSDSQGELPAVTEELSVTGVANDASDASPMDMEYYLGMEAGVTAHEKAQGLGAKSDVVQESMVRSVPVPTSFCGKKYPSKFDDDHDAAQPEDKEQTKGTGKRHTVHVEGRPTKLPYRIDHVLQETTVDQYTNEYLLGMRSHFRYWGNRDIAYHILRTMLEPKNSSSEDPVLDLKLDMPAPVTASKGAKEVAEAKAKATGRSRDNSMGTADQETKKQNRKSFSFSFFGYDNSSTEDSERENEREKEKELRRQKEEADEELAMMDEEGELFGHRHSDLDLNCKANTDFTASATFSDSSKGSKQSWSASFPSHGPDMESDRLYKSSSSKRRISMKATDKAEETGAESAVAQTKIASFEEGWVPIPELTRPAKLHHRSSRVEEKQ
ncbi:DDHD domain-containing protein [Dissophora ornata]|nr:DDHD domain-containing protein [Dissophora ornata]